MRPLPTEQIINNIYFFAIKNEEFDERYPNFYKKSFPIVENHLLETREDAKKDEFQRIKDFLNIYEKSME
jgi:hypothetical protein